ncbi:MAG: thioredoxin family protein [bacterium]
MGGDMSRLVTYLSFILLMWPGIEPARAQVEWLTDFDEAKEIARSENKLLLLDFWAKWCGPCLAMDRDVWVDDEVMQLSDKVVMVRVNVDHSRQLSMRYGTGKIPTMAFLDCSGNKLLNYIGYKDAAQMSHILRMLPANLEAIYIRIEALEKNPDNVILQIALGDSYRSLGLVLKSRLPVDMILNLSNDFYKAASKSNKMGDKPWLLDKAQTSMAMNYLTLGNSRKAKSIIKKCMKKFPESNHRPAHLYCMVQANLLQQDRREARKFFDMLKSEFPEDGYTRKAQASFD